jgi:hypothetical protein
VTTALRERVLAAVVPLAALAVFVVVFMAFLAAPLLAVGAFVLGMVLVRQLVVVRRRRQGAERDDA